MFRAERLVKWRTKSISPTSGKGGGASARWLAGTRAAGGPSAGTSQAGSRWVRRPGWERSKRRSVDWMLFIGIRLHEPAAGSGWGWSVAAAARKRAGGRRFVVVRARLSGVERLPRLAPRGDQPGLG